MTAQTVSAGTRYTYVRCDCTTSDPTPTAQGNDHASPLLTDHTNMRKRRNGSSRLCGCQGSKSSSLPIDQHMIAVTSIASMPSIGPPRRRATSAIPTTARQFSSPAATATPQPVPNTRTGTA